MEATRRTFLKNALVGSAALGVGIVGVKAASAGEMAPMEPEGMMEEGMMEEGMMGGMGPLPAPMVDESAKGIDVNINMSTIDMYLGRPDVAYRDVRHLYKTDEAGMTYVDLTSFVKGFKITPYIRFAPMSADSVSGTELFTLEWDAEGNIVSAVPNYEESMLITEDLFPKGMPIFLMCASGGRANLTRKLLVFLGWDPAYIYNLGGEQDYFGENTVEIIMPSDEHGMSDVLAVWRADYADINPDMLHPLG